MSSFIKFTDAVTGTVSLRKGFQRDSQIIKDSSSKSGEALIAQIEMTHSGVVTRNRGFYLPDNMKRGASSFTKHYNKPVLIGHDADTDPVGRVIKADYIDTSLSYVTNDSYLSSLLRFEDKKKLKTKEDITSFAQYIINEYNGKDSYRGLGHILGTLKITDEQAIQKVLDERYLTVSISMSSDAAYCSECGQDWVSEGPCEHERGQTYDSGVPVVLIPGKQTYNHVGFVSEPADQFAAGFKGIELIGNDSVKQLDSVIQVNENVFADKFSIAANLFSYKDSKLISLSDELQTNLFEVKDSIQNLEDSLKTMEKQEMKKGKFADDVNATISLYMSGEEGEGKSVEIRQYLKSLAPGQLEEMAKKAAAALVSEEEVSEDAVQKILFDFFVSQLPQVKEVATSDSVVVEEERKPVMRKTKTLNEKLRVVDGVEYDQSIEDSILAEIQKIEGVSLTIKEATELASLIAKSQNGDILASLTIETKDKTIQECIDSYLENKKLKFKLSAASEEEVVIKMNEHLSEDLRISFDSVVAKDCAGSGRYFPILNKACVEAAKKVLSFAVTSDSVKARIIENIEKISSRFAVETKDAEVEAEASIEKNLENTENFDSIISECNNQIELNDETLIAELTKLVQVASEREIIDSIIAPFLVEKEQEIGVLERQLLLANDEIDNLLNSLTEMKDNRKKELAEKVVDAKIKSGLFEVSDRESELEKHLRRTEDSLKDAISDLENTRLGRISDSEKVVNPVLSDDANDLNSQIIKEVEVKDRAQEDLKEKELLRTYNLLKTNKGRPFADKWLKQQNYQG